MHGKGGGKLSHMQHPGSMMNGMGFAGIGRTWSARRWIWRMSVHIVGGLSVSLQSVPPDYFNGTVYYFCETTPYATTGMSTLKSALSSTAHHEQVSSVYGFLIVLDGECVGLSPGNVTLKPHLQLMVPMIIDLPN